MLRPVLFLVGGLAMCLLPGCAYDNAEDVFADLPPQECDAANATYRLTISPILNQHCRSCHNAKLQTGNVVLETYDQVKRYADNGRLMGVTSHAPGFAPMPQGQPKLSDCDLARIKKWVDDKAPNN